MRGRGTEGALGRGISGARGRGVAFRGGKFGHGISSGRSPGRSVGGVGRGYGSRIFGSGVGVFGSGGGLRGVGLVGRGRVGILGSGCGGARRIGGAFFGMIFGITRRRICPNADPT